MVSIIWGVWLLVVIHQGLDWIGYGSSLLLVDIVLAADKFDRSHHILDHFNLLKRWRSFQYSEQCWGAISPYLQVNCFLFFHTLFFYCWLLSMPLSMYRCQHYLDWLLFLHLFSFLQLSSLATPEERSPAPPLPWLPQLPHGCMLAEVICNILNWFSELYHI